MVCALLFIMPLLMLFVIMKAKRKSKFGWGNVFANYHFGDFMQDAWLPLTVASILLIVAQVNDVNLFEQLENVLDIGIAIIPSMVALIVAAYTIMFSFILGEKVSEIKEKDGGKEFVQSINSSFAMCLLVSIVTIIVIVFVKCICSMDLGVEPTLANVINSAAYFLACFLLTYSVFILIGIVIDIYNSGQTSLL